MIETSASSPRAPSIIPTENAENIPLPGTPEQDIVSTDVPSSTSRQQEEDETNDVEEKQREESIIRKQEIWEKSVPKTKISAGSVSTPSLLLACLTGGLILWL
ncbi:hypothetical protein ILYODFUR_024853 [Ilyodon furcidens]|uniref:Uncharacterized protein n=1 Tax=Ilyodon furcidens TaxID=33524 RepID=A0ABV0UA36_9TELE